MGTDCTKYLGDQPAVLYTFVMDQQKHCEGYVVQWNQMYCNTKGCDYATDCPNKVPETAAYASKPFLEAWYVAADAPGPTGPNQGVIGGKTHIYHNDSMDLYFPIGTCGAIVIRGEIRFICKEDTGDLGYLGHGRGGWTTNATYGPPTCSHGSGAVPSTGSIPSWWNNPKHPSGERKDQR